MLKQSNGFFWFAISAIIGFGFLIFAAGYLALWNLEKRITITDFPLQL